MNNLKITTAILPLVIFSAPTLAHEALCDCSGNGDGTITCEAGFSNGADAVGATFQIRDMAGKVLIEGVTNERSDFSFRKPDVDFVVELKADENHAVLINGSDIEDSAK